MPSKPTFKVLVLDNGVGWGSLQYKIEGIEKFYADVCDLDIQIIRTRLSPVFTNSTAGLNPALSVIDEGWYDVNITQPYAAFADIIIFVSGRGDRIGIQTYNGVAYANNAGPYEIAVFAAGENDSTYVNGHRIGNSFVVVTCHELSHVFYSMCNRPDNTHQFFYGGSPEYVLGDFDFSSYSVRMAWLRRQLARAMTAIGFLRQTRTDLTN